MSDTYKPESIEDLWQQSSTVLQNAYNSGYIVGVEQGIKVENERIIKLLEAEIEYLEVIGEYYLADLTRKYIGLIKGEK